MFNDIKQALKNNLNEEDIEALRKVRNNWNESDVTTKRRIISGTALTGLVAFGGLPVLCGAAAIGTVMWGAKGELQDRAKQKMLEDLQRKQQEQSN